MLCVIPHILKDASDHSDSDNRKQVNNVTKKMFHVLSEDDLHFNIDLSWTDYTEFDNNIGISRFSVMVRVWVWLKENTSVMVIFIWGIINIHFLAPRLLVL